MDLGTLGAASMLAITLVAVAVLSKIIGCGLGALASGFSPRDSIRVGVGMLPRAEIALVIAAIGVKAGIATPALLSVTITIVLITTLVTPMLASLAFRGPRTGKV
jgi:Kef-type K+ transport system membrane component KefB